MKSKLKNKKTMRKRLWKKLIFVLLVLTITFVFVYDSIMLYRYCNKYARLYEISKQLFETSGGYVDSKNPKIGFCFPPNLSYETHFNGSIVYYSHNSLGLRDKEHNITKPDNTFRIIILGDSFTYGYLLNLSDSYPYILSRLLNENPPTNLSFEVFNFGIPGYGTEQEVALLEEYGLRYKPDIVVLQVLHNDIVTASDFRKCSLKLSKKLVRVEQDLLQRVLLSYAKNLMLWSCSHSLALKHFENHMKIVLRNIDYLAQLGENSNFTVIIFVYHTGGIVSPSDKEDEPYKFYTLVKKQAMKNNLIYIDMIPSLSEIPLKDRVINADLEEYHPSAKSNRLVAEKLYEVIKNVVNENYGK